RYMEPDGGRRFQRRFGELGRDFGRARDWDVFLTESLPRLRPAAPEAASAVEVAAAAARATAAAQAVALARGPGDTRLILELGLWMESGDWRRGLRRKVERRLSGPLEPVLGDLLDPMARTVRKRGKGLRSLPLDRLHALRKAVKRL